MLFAWLFAGAAFAEDTRLVTAVLACENADCQGNWFPEDDKNCRTDTYFFYDSDADGFRPEGMGTCCVAESLCLARDLRPEGWREASELDVSAPDCDDENAARNPTESEVCDGYDNDCDASVPAEETDDDRDLYVECSYSDTTYPADATILGGDDCDDTTANAPYRHPDASETCDGIDNDCDGALDPEEEDADRDDYVLCTVTTWRDPTSSKDGDDCDDDQDQVYPFADEVCDGVDSDCDGAVPSTELDDDGDGHVECDDDGYTWLGTSAVYGYSDCDDTESLRNPGYTSERCDGIDNDCRSGVPSNETDRDGDRYIECTLTGEYLGTGTISGGSDCDESCADCYPRSSYEVCDGSDNDCDGLLDDEDTLNSSASVIWYRDQDGDGAGLATSTSTACTRPSGYVSTSGDCDDDRSSVYPGAPELCDGVVTDCTTRTTGGSLDTEEIDLDSDGYVACDYDGLVTWAGSGAVNVGLDCAPTDPRTYPYADELCDGVYNDCTARSSPDATDEAPSNEEDDDGDGYVECYDGSTTWRGTPDDGTDDPLPGEDCSDFDATSYPGASELCDGIFNDCDDPQYGVSAAPDDELDVDDDGYIECTYVAADWAGSSIPIDGDDCEPNDPDVYPNATELCDGRYNDCDDADYGLRAAPESETDDDADGFVECRYADASWAGDALVAGGLDCDDGDAAVAPGAAEVCDGQFNDCEDVSWVEDGEPDDERDDDGDGFVECVRYDRVTWNPWDAATPEPNLACADAGTACFDCDDTDAETWPGAAWAEDALACMRDGDLDGYGDLALDGDDEDAGLVAGTDCNDFRDTVHPTHPEECEDGAQVDNDCDGSVNTLDGVPVEDGPVALYVDADRDGFGDADAPAALNVCDNEDGFSTSATDCDDVDPVRYPGATELCNAVDDDCDTRVDESADLDPGVSGCVDLYRDADRDGYGDPDESLCLCLVGGADTVEEDGHAWVQNPEDCDDLDANVHPLSCRDGIDQDGDALVDDADPDCQLGFDERGVALEPKRELLDGNDDDCDGYVPLVELDCDDDGALAAPGAAGETVYSAADLGLGACSSARTLTARCWDDAPITLECDDETGLWGLRLEGSPDGYGGRFDGGRRVYAASPTCSGLDDCDDRCAARCPGAEEACDGIDNDCSDVVTADGGGWDDGAGLPASLDPARGVAGSLPAGELDLDGDGFLACDVVTDGALQWTAASCDDRVLDALTEPDCNNRCGPSRPDAPEVCDGFVDTCDGPPEGTDGDRDGRVTCGAWSGDGADATDEHVYVVAHVADAPGGDTADSGTPDTADSGTPDTADSAGGDSAGADSAPDSAPDSAGADSSDSAAGAPSTVVPLLLPRLCPDGDGGLARCACDDDLYDGLVGLLGADVVDAAVADDDPTPLLAACDDGRCAVLRLTLSRSVDDETWERWVPEAAAEGRLSAACEDAAEQLAARTIWPQERILQARALVVEQECRTLYGVPCADVVPGTVLAPGWNTRVAMTEAALRAQAPWIEVARFAPETAHEGTVGWCWGDPTELDPELSTATGGDCADGAEGAHRDAPEGPGDVVGLVAGAPADCDSCVDGLDNNCDGAIDCADPACAPCFVGQGGGCGGDPCDGEGGCASESSAEPAAWFGLVLAALFARRRRRSA